MSWFQVKPGHAEIGPSQYLHVLNSKKVCKPRWDTLVARFVQNPLTCLGLTWNQDMQANQVFACQILKKNKGGSCVVNQFISKKMFWFPPHASLPWIGFLRGLAFRPWNALYEGLTKRRASQSAQVASGNWVGAMLSGACKMEDQRLTDQRLVTSGMRVRRIQHTSRRARPELSDCAMEWLCLQTMLPDSWLIPVFCLGLTFS